jgi:hypothetical protein
LYKGKERVVIILADSLSCVYQVHRVGSSLIMKITLAYLFFTMVLYSLIVFGLVGPEFDNVKGEPV